MRRLRLLLAGRRADGERGAIAVLTAVLVMFVAIGMLALTVDLGNVTYNRAQLQNGADATSLALAAACVQQTDDGAECAVTDQLRALAVKNANATDQSMQILTDQRTCISASYSGPTDLPDCTGAASPTSLRSCQPIPANLPASASYVEVTTQTQMKDGSSVLPFHFAQLLEGGKTGSTTQTCARAAWGPAGSSGATMPIAVSVDCYNKLVSSPADRYPIPNGGKGHELAVFTHTTSGKDDPSADPCRAGSNNAAGPGGFQYLSNLDGSKDCATVSIPVGDWADGKTGSAPCTNFSQYKGTVIGVPVYGATRNNGSSLQYMITGIAAFYLVGFHKLDPAKPSTDQLYPEPTNFCAPANKCTGSDNYIWGWFTDTVLPSNGGTIGAGPDLGAHIVVPAG